jgi:hypothetical protein
VDPGTNRSARLSRRQVKSVAFRIVRLHSTSIQIGPGDSSPRPDLVRRWAAVERRRLSRSPPPSNSRRSTARRTGVRSSLTRRSQCSTAWCEPWLRSCRAPNNCERHRHHEESALARARSIPEGAIANSAPPTPHSPQATPGRGVWPVCDAKRSPPPWRSHDCYTRIEHGALHPPKPVLTAMASPSRPTVAPLPDAAQLPVRPQIQRLLDPHTDNPRLRRREVPRPARVQMRLPPHSSETSNASRGRSATSSA